MFRTSSAVCQALRRCPSVTFVTPRISLYRQYSQEVWSLVREVVPTVEQAGIDEGYLDLGTVVTAFTVPVAVTALCTSPRVTGSVR